MIIIGIIISDEQIPKRILKWEVEGKTGKGKPRLDEWGKKMYDW